MRHPCSGFTVTARMFYYIYDMAITLITYASNLIDGCRTSRVTSHRH